MALDRATARYRKWYARLLRLYPKPFRERFAEPMEQTFHDLLRERRDAGRGLLSFSLWMFVETTAGIVRQRRTIMLKQNKRLSGIVITIVILLLVPLVAMQFTDEVNWTLYDFVVAGVLLFGTGLTFEFAARKAGHIAYRAAVGVALGTALLLTWANLAVGLIGSENNPANLLFALVIPIGIIGAGIARFRPRGMARALFATAIAQALVPVAALLIWKLPLTSDDGPGMVGVFVLNTFFVGLFLLSAFLFRHAGATDSS